jgi:ABC-type multidrug transport system ATPase subunit
MSLTHMDHRISSPEARKRLVDNLLAAFGMTSSADVLVGTPVRKGLSGGQKRRISVASQLVTAPKLLFLDECTSGLDSTASFETMRFIREITKRFRLIVICSIHQPSTSTFELFDTLCLLGGGRVCYFGPVHEVHPYFGSIGFPIPQYVNPAEYLLEVVNVDFSYAAGRVDDSADTLSRIHRSWADSPARQELRSRIQSGASSDGASEKGYPPRGPLELGEAHKRNFLVPVLLHRMFIKSYRDVFVYGLRLAMYFGE